LIGSFEPFYSGQDPYLIGLRAVDIAEGSYEYTNEFLQKDIPGFLPNQHVKTIYHTIIPIGAIGIFGLSAFSYLLGGYYALFYLGPIITILFLIISERVVTKLFGSFVGLVALIFLSTNLIVLYVGQRLLTDSIFGLFLILGCFFLLKFLREKKEFSILLCSVFLVTGTFFRYNGVIFLPVEILLVFSYFLFQYINNRNEDFKIRGLSNSYLSLLNPKLKKKFLKISLYILGPWAIFFIFLVSFNSYFFDDPFTNYWEQRRSVETENVISSYFLFDSERFDSIISYSALILPDQINNQLKTLSFNSDSFEPFLSIISFSLIFSALFISLKYKINRKEIIVFITFILGLILFYSTGPVVDITKTIERFMLGALPLFFGIIGYLMYQGWKINYQKISSKNFQLISKSCKGFLIIIFTIILLSSIYYSPPVNSIITEQNFKFKNPQVFADRYPLDKEGLTEKSVVLSIVGKYVVEYDVIPFNPYKGYSYFINDWRSEELKQEPIKLVKEMIDDGYELYVLKYKRGGNFYFYKYLEEEHGLILKEYSKTFCKLLRIENASGENKTQIQSDAICHSYVDSKTGMKLKTNLKIKGDPTTTSFSDYQIIVTGQIFLGPKTNPDDILSPDGTTVNGGIPPNGVDDYFFTGDIVSITADKHILSFVDGVEVPNGS